MTMCAGQTRTDRRKGGWLLSLSEKNTLGANVDFPKYFEKYDSLVRKEKFPEIYHTCVDANDTDA